MVFRDEQQHTVREAICHNNAPAMSSSGEYAKVCEDCGLQECEGNASARIGLTSSEEPHIFSSRA
jgi:hypothetical protein